MPKLLSLLSLAALLAACGPSTSTIEPNVDAGTGGGTGLGGGGGGGAGGTGGGLGGGGGGGSGGGGATDPCVEAAKLIYVVDQDKTVSSFDPRNLGTATPAFTDLGRLSCPAATAAEPFSMSVDRNAQGWVIYDSGELFTVDLTSPNLTCTKTSFMPQQNIGRFGMGFVSDLAGSQSETLFISGSPLTGPLPVNTELATLSTTPPHTITKIATLTGAPELTGTGDAKLWGFFPDTFPPTVKQLDKGSGQAVITLEAQSLSGDPLAWAFSFWGGSFYIFLERLTDSSTNVWKMDSATGSLTKVLPNTGRTIVGAGVSTCAPVTIN